MEAAFIMPFVIYLLIGFIFLAYLMYDNCRIEEAVQNQFLSANRWMLHETDLSSEEFLEECVTNKTGKNAGKHSIWFNGNRKDKKTGIKKEYCKKQYEKYIAKDFSRFH